LGGASIFLKHNMKKSLLLALVAFLMYSNTAAAQTQDTTKYLLKLSKPHSFGLYVSPEFQYGQLKNAFTPFAGSSVMLLFNQKFAIGATYQETTNQTFSPTGVSPLLLKAGYGGVKMEFITAPSKAVHVTFPIVIGMGQMRVDSATYTVTRPRNHNDFGENFNGRNSLNGGNTYLVLQPGIHLEANLIRNVKIYAGASYRYAVDVDGTANTATIPLAASVLNGASINVGAKIGFFNFQPSKVRRPHLFGRNKHKE
jgi:hypothetical protein